MLLYYDYFPSDNIRRIIIAIIYMTKQGIVIMSEGQVGAKTTDIEISPQMMEAGLAALDDFDRGWMMS